MASTPASYNFRKISYHGAGRIKVPSNLVDHTIDVEYTEGEYSICSILDVHKFYRNASAASAPLWWNESVAQAQQAQSHQNPLIVKCPDNSYIVCGRYSERFFQWTLTIPGGGVIYDEFLESVIIDDPMGWPVDTNDFLVLCGVQATQVSSGFIAPRTQQAVMLEKYGKIAQSEGYDIPDNSLFPTSRTFMKHQVDVARVFAWRGRGIIADDVGSGKGTMFYGGFFSQVQKKVNVDGYDFADCFPLVVVTKKSLADPISREAQAWFNTARISVIGKKSKMISGGLVNHDPQDAHIVVCPLSILTKRLDEIMDLDPKGVVFDESHMVKNMQAQRTQAAVALANYVKENNEHPYTVCVSATPMPNRPQELWAQLVIAGIDTEVMKVAEAKQSFPPRVRTKFNGNYMMPVTDQTKFEMRYCQGRPGAFGWDASGSCHEKELSAIMYDNGLVRRKKSEFITPLPPLYQKFVNCDITPEDAQRYTSAEEEFKGYLVSVLRKKSRKENWKQHELYSAITDKLGKAEHSEAIMKMTAVRQLAGEIKVPYIVDWIGRFFDGDPTIVKNGKNQKLIVFSHHKGVQEKIINHPDLEKHGVMSIQAGQKDVNDIVDKFQDPDSGKNLLICYSEAREGLTLTASHAVLIVEMPWSPSWILQMAGRCWARFSEKYDPHEATVYYAVADVEIDKYLVDMVRKKGWLNKAIIDPEIAVDEINAAEAESEK